MRKRRYFVLLFAIGMLLAVVAIVSSSRAPSHDGRSLSWWVESYSFSAGVDRGPYTPMEREKAIHAMGTNSIPYLLKWLRYETQPWKSKFYSRVNPLLSKLKPSWQLTDETAQVRANGAVFALITLCPKADGTAAELAKLVNDPAVSPGVRGRAANVLACIDPRSWKDQRIDGFFREAP